MPEIVACETNPAEVEKNSVVGLAREITVYLPPPSDPTDRE